MFLCTYLDYAGAPLVHPDLIDAVVDDLKKLLLGNPHSRNTTSVTTTDLIDQCRYRILKHFSTTTEEYSVIFTSNCTAALKLVAECFDWMKCKKCSTNTNKSATLNEHFSFSSQFSLKSGPDLIYLQDNHTSVIGMREYALTSDANVYCITDSQFDDIFQNATTMQDAECHCNSLFVYPLQSNFCGRKYPLEWVDRVQNMNKNGDSKKWFVCADVASFVATSELNLSKYRPDFVTLSFYKIFGYPTGLGALLVRNESAHVLKKRYFGGGTLASYIPGKNVFKYRNNLSEKFEDGTAPFQQIIALRNGFQMLEKQGGIQFINEKTFSLAQSAFLCLQRMRHSNGEPVAKIYTHDTFSTKETQGPIVNFNLLKSDGRFVGYGEVEQMAELYNIQLRTGCFCNQGACQIYLHLSDDQLLANLEAGKECGDVIDLMNGQPLGSVRISFGFMSSIQDVKHFVKMVYDCFMEKDVSHNFDSYWKTLLPNIEHNALQNGLASKQIKYDNNPRNFHSRIEEAKPVISLTDIIVYPLKSCAGINASEWSLSKTGLLFDRHWMITNEDGLCLNQKREPKLALIKPHLTGDFEKLELSYKGYDKFYLNIHSKDAEIENNNFLTTDPICQTKVCADRVTTCDGGDDVADWISLVLDRSYCRLASQLDSNPRLSKRNKSSSHATQVSLANQEQYLLVNRASIRRLLHLIHTTNPEITENDLISRFRPNLVIDGALPFEEDSWKKITIGTFKFTCVGKCTRCQMICINQETAEMEPNILVALRDIKENKITFGIYLCGNEKYDAGKISVGDAVVVES